MKNPSELPGASEDWWSLYGNLLNNRELTGRRRITSLRTYPFGGFEQYSS